MTGELETLAGAAWPRLAQQAGGGTGAHGPAPMPSADAQRRCPAPSPSSSNVQQQRLLRTSGATEACLLQWHWGDLHWGSSGSGPSAPFPRLLATSGIWTDLSAGAGGAWPSEEATDNIR
ncbi:hypothetical protein E4U55_008273, partial [Claviceps digitariae]